MEITVAEIERAIQEVRIKDNETSNIEVKENQLEADKMGKTISAIANNCLLDDREYGYIIFGIKDKTWEVVGTSKKIK